MNYEDYIKSESWRRKRKLRLEHDHYQCRTCRSKDMLEVHHVTYDRFGDEDLEDLITLCKECHQAVTNIIRMRRHQSKVILKTSIKQEVVYYGDTESSTLINRPINLSQQSRGGPSELLRKRDEKDIREKKQNRIRPLTTI